MPERTYTGPAPRGRVTPIDRSVAFVRGEPVEFTSEEAGRLDDDWSTPKAAKAKPEPKGAKPDTKES